jgi:hypothetical protein
MVTKEKPNSIKAVCDTKKLFWLCLAMLGHATRNRHDD